jgi:NTP pyrophosphohydrolases including oxidative damage repair enzymes
VIDENGYRLNVGIIVSIESGMLLWAQRRFGGNGWQFPQGGMKEGESPLGGMSRHPPVYPANVAVAGGRRRAAERVSGV